MRTHTDTPPAQVPYHGDPGPRRLCRPDTATRVERAGDAPDTVAFRGLVHGEVVVVCPPATVICTNRGGVLVELRAVEGIRPALRIWVSRAEVEATPEPPPAPADDDYVDLGEAGA